MSRQAPLELPAKPEGDDASPSPAGPVNLANPTAIFSTAVMGGNVVAAVMSLIGNQDRTELDIVRDEILNLNCSVASSD